jgi:hypothetical protein
MKDRSLLWRGVLTAFVSALVVAFCRPALAQSWTQLKCKPKSPPARDLASAVFDPKSQKMIMFGGGAYRGTRTNDLNDVWYLSKPSGSSIKCVEAKPTGGPPAPRIGNSAVYDEANDRMTIFGGGLGGTSPCQNDVWVLENASGRSKKATPNWIQLSPGGTAPAPRLVFEGAVYDPVSNEMIVFGGNNCFQTEFDDVWILKNANGLGGTPSWEQVTPSGSGPPAGPVSAAYDSSSNTMIVYDAAASLPVAGGTAQDAWILSNANGIGGTPTWTQLSPSGLVPAPRGAATTYDQTNKRFTIYGGCGYGGGQFRSDFF